MGLPVPDGIYSIQLPMSESCVTDTGEGRYLSLLQRGALGPDAHKIKVRFNMDRGGYSLQFEKSKKYITFDGDATMNNKLISGDKPRYFSIKKHEYYEDLFTIYAAEDKTYHVGLALERIYPSWIALSNLPEVQAWHFQGVY